MKLSEVKQSLTQLERICFKLPNGVLVPNLFHVTEVGKITRHFIDCGGTVRNGEVGNFQLWNANDHDHKLHPEKMLKIVELSERIMSLADLEIEVEYQGETIQKFGLEFDGTHFLLTSKQTDCLAKEKCGIPLEKPRIKPSELQKAASTCSPNSGCC